MLRHVKMLRRMLFMRFMWTSCGLHVDLVDTWDDLFGRPLLRMFVYPGGTCLCGVMCRKVAGRRPVAGFLHFMWFWCHVDPHDTGFMWVVVTKG